MSHTTKLLVSRKNAKEKITGLIKEAQEIFKCARRAWAPTPEALFSPEITGICRATAGPFLDSREASSGYGRPGDTKQLSKDIFIVHGRDNAVKEEVARFIDKLGLHPIILHEKPDRGKTIIEKFEHHSDVGFAVVLLTPDDVGHPKDMPGRFQVPSATGE